MNNNDGVSKGGMSPYELNDEQLEQLLLGNESGLPADHPVASFMTSARASVNDAGSVAPDQKLVDFMKMGGAKAQTAPGVVLQLDSRTTSAATNRRPRMSNKISSFAESLTGRIVIGTSVAAATLGLALGVGALNLGGDAESVVPAEVGPAAEGGTVSLNGLPSLPEEESTSEVGEALETEVVTPDAEPNESEPVDPNAGSGDDVAEFVDPNAGSDDNVAELVDLNAGAGGKLPESTNPNADAGDSSGEPQESNAGAGESVAEGGTIGSDGGEG